MGGRKKNTESLNEQDSARSMRRDQTVDDNMPPRWRVGRKVPINVYEGDTPVCQCHTAADAARIVRAMNERLR